MSLDYLLAGLCVFGGGGAGDSAATAPARTGVVHAIGYVNDPLSHGLVGDGLLSLNEVIQLHNRVLALGQLSAAEQMQISGFGQDVAWAAIDSINVPWITVERDLDVILDMPHGLRISGGGESAVIDFTASGLQHGFRSSSDFCSWENLVIHGGRYGIDLVQTSAGLTTNGTVLNDVVFENQTLFAMRVTIGPPGGRGRVQMQRCTFTNLPAALQFDERAAGTTALWIASNVRMRSVSTCIEVLLGTGGTSWLELHQLDCDVPGTGVRIARPSNADRPLVFASNFASIRAAAPLELATSSIGATQLTLRMADLQGTSAAGRALAIGPLGGAIAGEIDELRADGNVDLFAGGALPLTVTNGRLRNGAIQLGSASGLPILVRETRLDACAVATLGASPVVLDGCCVVGGSLQGTAAAPLQCNTCHVQAAVGAGVVQNGALPAQQLGSLSVLPQTVAIGGPLIYQADLPPGLFGLFAIGWSQDPVFVTLLPYPLHVYSELQQTFTVPGVYRLQQSYQFAIPNDPYLVSSDLTAQMAVLPDPGVQAPWINLPPGRRFVIR